MAAADLVARLRSGGPHLSVGILTADLMTLGSELSLLEDAGIGIVHTDVMDGVFCPMLTVGAPFLGAQRTTMLKDAHLMVMAPEDKVEAFVAAGADIIAFHPEGTRHPHRALQVLRKAVNANDPERGIIRGISINPGTPVEAITPLLDEVEFVQILAVNPGWGGQAFIASTETRLAHARELIAASGREILLGVDGGVTRANIARIAGLGVDLIVTGSAIFDGKAAAGNAAFMLSAVRAAPGRA
ncbi:MAG: ribulose-phosphate 3-epimerase [Chloroflexota bacterium]